ncbi:IS4 family transposase [Kitasatospora sp. NPDC004531]
MSHPPTGFRPADRATLGILTRAFPPELVDQVLVECGRVEQRSRLLPARVVVYFVLAMALCGGGHGYPDVARLLVRDLERERWWPQDWQVPTTTAIGRARSRLGAEPLRRLFERTCPPPPAPGTADAWYRGRRLVALDGAILDVPDTPPNAAHFGRPFPAEKRARTRTASRHTPGVAARLGAEETDSYPQARVSALVECGTRTALTADVGPLSTHERALAEAIYPTLTRDMLVLADRGTTDPATWRAALAGGADLLWQVPSRVRLPVTARLDDGSHLTDQVEQADPAAPPGRSGEHARPTQVRVIDFTLDTDRRNAPPHRLLTSLLDPVAAPAADLATRYARQSRSGTALDHLTPARPARTLRSRHPDGIKQEIFALLLLDRAFPGPPDHAATAPTPPPTVQVLPAPH